MEQHLSQIPWRAYLPRPPIGYLAVIYGFYRLARAYLLFEDFVGLRQLPKSMFETVPRTQYSLQI